ncbi:MAG: RNA methyltransferase, partial [Clostridia bacterium]|nr:RNA methyltransferase [Clostridia bacterium]
MPPIVEITDLCDPRLDPYARLTERQLKQGNAEGRKTPERGIFIAESKTVVTLALDAGTEPLSFLMDESQLHGASRDLAERILAGEWGDVPLYTAPDPVLEELTGFSLNRGVLSAMLRPTLKAPEEVCAGARRIAVLEDIADAANVGAVFRSAAALGMDAVLVTARCSDPLLRRSARV